MEKVAIIGMGSSGMAVAAAYEKEVQNSMVEIDCYDTMDSFGRGFPYREDSEELILNLKTDKISYDYKNNDDFINWLKENNLPIKEYSSRNTFGLYTRSRLKDTLKNINANIIKQKVKDLDFLVEEKKWKLETVDNNIKLYDRVHLCSGEIPNKDPYNLQGYKGYIDSVYPAYEELSTIEENDSVAIIGLGLTGVDVATYLLKERKINKLYMFSRANIFPTVRVDPVELKINILSYEKAVEIIKKGNGIISFKEFDELFNKELASHGINYEDFLSKHMSGGIDGLKRNIKEPEDLAKVQALLPPMNVVFNKVWVSFTETDRKLFLEKYHPFMCLNRSPLPLPSAELLIESENKGQLIILKNISDIKAIDNGKSFNLLSRSSEVEVNCKWVCNATGLDTSLKTIDKNDTLLGRLLDKRYLQVDNYGGLTLLPEDMSAISPRLGNLPALHVHGVLASGVQYRNNSTFIIQKTAHDLIKKLY